MTIYNADPCLREAIDCLIGQTYVNWGLIVVENGSADSSPAILASYTDSRLQIFILLENIGRTPAIRYAFERASGEYVAITAMDAFDYDLRLAT